MSSSSDGRNLKTGGSWEIELGSFSIGINDEEEKGNLVSCEQESTETRQSYNLHGISCRWGHICKDNKQKEPIKLTLRHKETRKQLVRHYFVGIDIQRVSWPCWHGHWWPYPILLNPFNNNIWGSMLVLFPIGPIKKKNSNRQWRHLDFIFWVRGQNNGNYNNQNLVPKIWVSYLQLLVLVFYNSLSPLNLCNKGGFI